MSGTLRLASTVGFLLLAFSSSVLATWTSPAAKVEQVYFFENGGWVQLDPQVSVSNPGSCAVHNNWFNMPTAVRVSDDGKMWIIHIQLALAAGQEIEIYATQCNSGGDYNQIEAIKVLQ